MVRQKHQVNVTGHLLPRGRSTIDYALISWNNLNEEKKRSTTSKSFKRLLSVKICWFLILKYITFTITIMIYHTLLTLL